MDWGGGGESRSTESHHGRFTPAGTSSNRPNTDPVGGCSKNKNKRDSLGQAAGSQDLGVSCSGQLLGMSCPRESSEIRASAAGV